MAPQYISIQFKILYYLFQEIAFVVPQYIIIKEHKIK